MDILGIDVGSTVAKFVIINEKTKEIKKKSSFKLYGDPIQCVKNAFENNDSLSSDMKMSITGSSRNLIANIYKAELTKPEIVAHIYGVSDFLSKNDLVFEIGGQDSKVIMLKNRVISNFRMNSNCAAGTGSFIEAQARRFGLNIQDLDEMAIESDDYVELNAKCATFLESSLINLQREGKNKEVLAATVFHSIANNYLASMCQGIDFDKYDNIIFIGGVAKLKAMKKAFENILKRDIYVPKDCEYMGAIGAAKILIDRSTSNMNEYNNGINDVIQCKGCQNRCILKSIEIDGKVMYNGGLCGKNIFV